jgi:hypothetical protein
MFRDVVNQTKLETETRHKQLGLVTGFAHESHRVVAGQFRSKPFPDQSDLGRADAINRFEKRRQHEKRQQTAQRTRQKRERRYFSHCFLPPLFEELHYDAVAACNAGLACAFRQSPYSHILDGTRSMRLRLILADGPSTADPVSPNPHAT